MFLIVIKGAGIDILFGRLMTFAVHFPIDDPRPREGSEMLTGYNMEWRGSFNPRPREGSEAAILTL